MTRFLHLTPATIVLTVALLATYAALTACTPHRYATCENARIAVEMAQRAADRFCPMEARR